MNELVRDIDLCLLEGCTVQKVDSGDWDLQIHLEPAGFVGIDGAWTYHHAWGETSHNKNAIPVGTLSCLVDRTIARLRVDPGASFTLIFSDGTRLTVPEAPGAYTLA
ncbi:MAG: hypothetical protein ACYTAF_05200 [Planctomycetota bacterium]|jgi:hypothetical protein